MPVSGAPAAARSAPGPSGRRSGAGRAPEPVRAPAAAGRATTPTPVRAADGREFEIDHGAVVIASITSCTNTSNPSVMVGAALLAKNAVERGLAVKPWVKTTLAPGSKVVTDYYERAGLTPYLDKLGFNLVGYGCTTCIGNSGPLPEEISAAVNENDLAVVSVLSGNRNFEGRINPDVKMNYLASPPLVVAYALAGTMDFDFDDRAARHRRRRRARCTCATSGRRPQEVGGHRRGGDQPGDVHARTTPTSSPATSGGARCRRRPATPSPGTRSRPTSASRPYFDGMPRGPGAGHRRRRAPACWRCSATR